MAKIYAQLDEDQRVVVVSSLEGEVIAPNMIELETYDTDLLGKIYKDGVFVDPPAPNEMFFVLTATGGDGQDPIGVDENGTNPIQIRGILKDAVDNPVASLDGSRWRISIRASDGQVWDIIMVKFVGAEVAFQYKPSPKMPCGDYEVSGLDFAPVEVLGASFFVRLVPDPFRFKVYREV